MKWVNLKNNKCPSCGSDLTFIDGFRGSKSLLCKSCDFKISEDRMNEIVSKMYKRNYNDRILLDGIDRFDFENLSDDEDEEEE